MKHFSPSIVASTEAGSGHAPSDPTGPIVLSFGVNQLTVISSFAGA